MSLALCDLCCSETESILRRHEYFQCRVLSKRKELGWWMFRRLPGGWRRNFIPTPRQSIDHRGSAEVGVKSLYLRKPKYLQRPKSVYGRYESPWRSEILSILLISTRSNKKNIQDALFLLYSNVRNFFKQKRIMNVPEIPQMAVSGQAIASLEKDHFTWVCYHLLRSHSHHFL